MGDDGNIIDSIFIGNTANFRGGGIYWSNSNGTISSSTFINNTVISWGGGGVCLIGPDSIITSCTFIGNAANHGGGVHAWGSNDILMDSTFTNNSCESNGGGASWDCLNGIVMGCTFNSNFADHGGGVYWNQRNGIITKSTFINNTATATGGGISFNARSINCTMADCTFDSNSANDYGGGIYWYDVGSMANCSFANGKSPNSNGIYARSNLIMNGGNGVVYISIHGTLTGTSIVVLNNETYYYPPNTNINFKDNNMQKEMIYQCMNIYSQLD